MKKNYILLFIAAIMTVSGCEDTFYDAYNNFTGPVQSVELKSEASIVIYTSEQLVPVVYPSLTENKNVTWESDLPGIASVDSSGTVTANALGSAVITVTTVDGGFTDTCTVTVVPTPISVDTVSLDASTLTVGTGQQRTLVAGYSPSNATSTAMSWSSSNSSIASVDSTGLVTGVTNGTATITVTAVNWGKSAACTVTVSQPVPVTGVSMASVKTADIGETIQLTASVTPSNASNQGLSWQSIDSSIATVNQSGLVTAVGGGTTYIIVTTKDGGESAFCRVNIYARVTYNSNGATGGSVPADGNSYSPGQSVAVSGNTGNLKKIQVNDTSYRFDGWNTQPDGNGTDCSSSFFMGTGNVVLYAKWTAYAVGDTGPAGGKIFYDAGSYKADPVNSSYGSWRYLEAPPADLGTCSWGVSGDSIPIVEDYFAGKGPGWGKSNTALIVAQYPSGNYAANICDNYSLNGYDDWFLPAFCELMELQKLKASIGAAALGLSYTVYVNTSRYWVSSPYGSDDTRGPLYRFDSAMWSDTRTNTWRVVPIRRF